jgi:hypothetical protein
MGGLELFRQAGVGLDQARQVLPRLKGADGEHEAGRQV